MLNSFEKYGRRPDALALGDFGRIHGKLMEQIGDEDQLDAYYDVLLAAQEYVIYRQRWNMMSVFEKALTDDERTEKHDEVIRRMEILEALTPDRKWAEELDLENRKRVGDMACWLMFVEGINAR